MIADIKTRYVTIQYNIVLEGLTAILTPVNDRIRILDINPPNFRESQEDYIPEPLETITVNLKKYWIDFKSDYGKIWRLEECVRFLINEFIKHVEKCKAAKGKK
jgi:hypothetical protein